jgi:hypothetical protein
MEAFDLDPGPKQAASPFISNSAAMGPLIIMTWAAPPVVAAFPPKLKSLSNDAFTAATTTGKYSGLQPAITALMAIFSKVAWAFRGCIVPRDKEGAPL